jgi:hypothetical protein
MLHRVKFVIAFLVPNGWEMFSLKTEMNFNVKSSHIFLILEEGK